MASHSDLEAIHDLLDRAGDARLSLRERLALAAMALSRHRRIRKADRAAAKHGQD